MVLTAALTALRQKRNAERPWRRSHAEREERSFTAPPPDRSHALRGHVSRDALRHLPKRNAERPWRHSHAEREERSFTAPPPDRSHALRGHASRDALRHLPEAERGASLAAFHAEREERSFTAPPPDRSHALRGHASRDALRHLPESGTQSVPGGVPTRSVRNDRSPPRHLIVPTLCVGMHPVTLCVTFQKRNAERPWRHSRAEREERSFIRSSSAVGTVVVTDAKSPEQSPAIPSPVVRR